MRYDPVISPREIIDDTISVGSTSFISPREIVDDTISVGSTSFISRGRELIFNNFWLKCFSAVLATLIWLALRQSDLPSGPTTPMNPLLSRTKEVDVTRLVSVLKSPTEQRVFRVDPPQVTVKLGGDANMLAQLNPEDVHVYVNVGALKDPQGSLRVEVHVPPKIAIQAISPAHVDVRPIDANP